MFFVLVPSSEPPVTLDEISRLLKFEPTLFSEVGDHTYNIIVKLYDVDKGIDVEFKTVEIKVTVENCRVDRFCTGINSACATNEPDL